MPVTMLGTWEMTYAYEELTSVWVSPGLTMFDLHSSWVRILF